MSLISNSLQLNDINLNDIDEKLSMIPFNTITLAGVPKRLLNVVKEMFKSVKDRIEEGEAYLTVHTKDIKPMETHRRGGPHIDGNYIKEICNWGSGGGNGWKVGENGRKLSTEHHKLSYETQTGGMLIASSHPACLGWNGIFDEKAKEGGDCSHIQNLNLKGQFLMKPNKVYYGTSQFIHESIPVEKEVKRTLIRITLPLTQKYLN